MHRFNFKLSLVSEVPPDPRSGREL